jgi:hypothetical protein
MIGHTGTAVTMTNVREAVPQKTEQLSLLA